MLQKIYIELWDNKYIEKNCLKKNNIYYSDTLTSAQTRLNDNIKVSKKELNLDIKNVSSKVIMKKYNSDEHFKNCLDSSEQFDEVREMIEKYHTLGNYCPVPKGFNNARSGFGVYDSINLMLEKIKEFYDGYNKNEILGNDNINAILELLRFKSTYKNTLEWLKGFGDWKTFVDNNFFQDYVDGEYELLDIWGNISWKNPAPKSLKECKDYCKKISIYIDLRTKRMYEALMANRK